MSTPTIPSFYESFSFGVHEVTMTILCALSGYVTKKSSEIIYILLVTGVASMVPDVYSYYLMQREKKISTIDSMKSTIPIFISEFLTMIIICIPIVLLKSKELRFIISFCIGLLIIILNQKYTHKNATIEQIFEPVMVTILGVFVVYSLTRFGDNVIMPFIKKYL